MPLPNLDPTIWKRRDGEIAVRIDAADVKRVLLSRPIVVDEGTVALTFSDGKMQMCEGGRSINLATSLGRLFDPAKPNAVVLVGNDEFGVTASIGDLFSADRIELSTSIGLRFAIADIEVFFQNTMKGREKYTVDDLVADLSSVLREALQVVMAREPIDTLFSMPLLRDAVEPVVRDRAANILDTLGIELVAIESLTLHSPQYEAIRSTSGNVAVDQYDFDLTAKRLDVVRRLREINARDGIHEARSQADLKDMVRQAVHELELKDIMRFDELAKLEATLAHDMEDFQQQRQLDRKAVKSDFEREEERQSLDSFLGRQIKTAEAAAIQRSIERDEKRRDLELTKETADWNLSRYEKLQNIRLNEKRTEAQLRRDDLEHEARIFDSVSPETQLRMGPDGARLLADYMRLQQEKAMTPAQILARSVSENPAAADALAEMYRSQGVLNQEMLADVRRELERTRQDSRESLAFLSKQQDLALTKMGKVATARARARGPGEQATGSDGKGMTADIQSQNPTPPLSPDVE